MVIGIILTASTSVIGASVVLLGVMAIPTTMDQGYSKPIATEASGIGTMGATILALFARNLNMKVFKDVMRQTLNTSGYIVGIFIAANLFAFILRRFGGGEIIENLVLGSFDNPYATETWNHILLPGVNDVAARGGLRKLTRAT